MVACFAEDDLIALNDDDDLQLAMEPYTGGNGGTLRMEAAVSAGAQQPLQQQPQQQQPYRLPSSMLPATTQPAMMSNMYGRPTSTSQQSHSGSMVGYPLGPTPTPAQPAFGQTPPQQLQLPPTFGPTPQQQQVMQPQQQPFGRAGHY